MFPVITSINLPFSSSVLRSVSWLVPCLDKIIYKTSLAMINFVNLPEPALSYHFFDYVKFTDILM